MTRHFILLLRRIRCSQQSEQSLWAFAWAFHELRRVRNSQTYLCGLKLYSLDYGIYTPGASFVVTAEVLLCHGAQTFNVSGKAYSIKTTVASKVKETDSALTPPTLSAPLCSVTSTNRTNVTVNSPLLLLDVNKKFEVDHSSVQRQSVVSPRVHASPSLVRSSFCWALKRASASA